MNTKTMVANYKRSWEYKLYQVAMALMFIVAGAIAVFVGMYVSEEPPVWYPDSPFAISEDAFYPGDEYTFFLTRCADYVTDYSWSQVYIEQNTGEEHWMPGSFATAQPGCVEIESVPKVIPNIPAGDYRLYFFLDIEGKLKGHEMTLRTESFKVLSNN